MTNKKNIWLILGGILIVVLIIIAIVADKTSPATKTSSLTKDTINFPFLTKDSKTLFYYDTNSTIKKLDLTNNQVTSWIKFPFPSVNDISYSPDGSQAIVYWSNSQTNLQEQRTWLIDLKNKKIIKEIGQNIFANAWSPDSKKIAIQYWDAAAKLYEINISNPDGTNPQKITVFDGNQADILWPNAQTLVYFNVPQADVTVDVQLVNLTSLQTKTILSRKTLEDAKALINQNKILFSSYDSSKDLTSLELYDLQTSKTQRINNDSLNINKVAQVPGTTNLYITWRPANKTTDSIAKITSTGQVQNLKTKLPDKIDATNLMLTNDGKTLYFLNNNQLYKINI